MRSTSLSPFVAAALGLSVVAMPAVASPAVQNGTRAQRATNERATTNLEARIDATEERIAEGRRGGAITRARAVVLSRQVAQTKSSMTRLSRQQGFVSAAELASYNRTLGQIDVELDGRGVARSYGKDMPLSAGSDREAGGFKYDCQNIPVSIAIPGDRLDRSLGQLRLATHCPISGTGLARGKRSQPVVGTMTPTKALQAMLSGTGLQMRTLKGGFQVVPLPR